MTTQAVLEEIKLSSGGKVEICSGVDTQGKLYLSTVPRRIGQKAYAALTQHLEQLDDLIVNKTRERLVILFYVRPGTTLDQLIDKLRELLSSSVGLATA